MPGTLATRREGRATAARARGVAWRRAEGARHDVGRVTVSATRAGRTLPASA